MSHVSRSRVRKSGGARRADAGGRPQRGTSSALIVIDHERLQREAWAEFHTVRKRMEKAQRDLHRHEEEDVPAYRQWLYTTFPTTISRLRELGTQVDALTRKIQAAQAQAFFHGGTLKRIWREHRAKEKAGEDYESMPGDRDEGEAAEDAFAEDPWFEAVPDEPTLDVRAIYRRLVQRLHPDRGGEWTPARERVWHQVQAAWAAGDADWLARLEVEWETANDVLGPRSPLSRLREAIRELDAARRDTEQKLRRYRKDPAWRFMKSGAKRPILHQRTQRELEDELAELQQQLDAMQEIVASWEDDWTKPKRSRRGARRAE